ncbi:MAG: hypothetical protein FJW39_05955 [Acidobacteria bacterium]|nr:hypothetical protein [Acidobacteriota bacterium]
MPLTAPAPAAASASTAQIHALLKKAAYFSLYSMPNPANPNVPRISLNPPGIVQVAVNEQLHRFPIDLAAGTQVGEPIATVAMKWTPTPENFVPIPDVMPPLTALSVASGQPFVTMDGALTFGGGTSVMHGFGHGRTFAQQTGGSNVLYIGAIVNMLSGLGHLDGMHGTVLVNGHIKPPTDLSLSVLARFVDPDRKFALSGALTPVQSFPNPDPSYGTLMLLAEVDPSAPVAAVERFENGTVAEWEMNHILRLISTNWDSSGPNGLRSEMAEGPVVARFTAKFRVALKSQDSSYVAYVASTTGGLLRFQDLKGNPIGTMHVDIEVANAFDQPLAGAPVPLYRLGGAGPINSADGIFKGAMGIMSVNGAFSIEPHAVSSLHVFRFFDPDGSIRTLMKDSWGRETRTFPATTLSAQDESIVGAVEDSLAVGLALRQWWQDKDAHNSFGERFDLVRSHNPADTAYGFFDQAPLKQGPINVMGLKQEMLFDCPKTAGAGGGERQVREYALRYFLRSTSFAAPVAAGGRGFNELPAVLEGLFFRNAPASSLRGFGFRQLY